MGKQLKFFALCLLALALLCPPALAAVAQGEEEGKKKKEVPRGTPVLWRDPGDVTTLDLFWGPGGEAMRPDTSRVTFIKQETGGYSTKYRVRDAAGRVWVAKVSKEAQSETAAVRLLWAAGYPTEINYLVPRVTIEGKGTFENVRFEARPDNVKRAGEWRWKKNPFSWTKELQGLIVLMALINNWDLKDSNNVILHTRGPEGDELHYAISDLGATFGKTGNIPLFWRLTRSRNEPGDYAKAGFVEDVKKGQVYFRYGGKNQDLFDDIKVEEARWIGDRLARLSDKQIADAFRAANYAPSEVQLLAGAVRSRIDELTSLPRPGAARSPAGN